MFGREPKGPNAKEEPKTEVLKILKQGGKLLKYLDKGPRGNNVIEYHGGSLGGTEITDEQIDEMVAEGIIKKVGQRTFEKDDQLYFPGKGTFDFYELVK